MITSCSWSGQPYSVDGVMYRDAVANVRQPVQMYRANYEGTVLVQDPDAVGQAYYSAPDPDGDVELTVTAIAVYEKTDVPIYNYIVTAVIVIGMLSLIFFLLYLIAKRKQKKEKKTEV